MCVKVSKICYIVGASDTQGIYIDRREDDYIIAADAGYSGIRAGKIRKKSGVIGL